MKGHKIFFLAIILLVIGCKPGPYKENTLKGIKTGVNPDQWVYVPQGTYYTVTFWRIIKEGNSLDSVRVGPYYSGRHLDTVDHDFEIMATEVTNAQYARFLNQALDSGVIKIKQDTIQTYYPGDPFTGYEHEFPVKPGYYPMMVLRQPGLHILYKDGRFTAEQGFENHPVVNVTWFGAWAYARFYGYRLPREKEWEKAAMGTDLRGYPWGNEINVHFANYMEGNKALRKIFGDPVRTTPVGFYNGKTYKGPKGSFETRDNRSPYGAYDMCGNVWEWCANDYPFIHYRYMRGGSYNDYPPYSTTWWRNNAEPWFSSPSVGFRCVRTPIAGR